jgi:60 kDa SS-A/Ro ribonucleoprotein
VLPFEQSVVDVRLDARDTVLSNAQRLAAVGGGGTNVSAPLKLLNDAHAHADLVLVVSDNESWVDARPGATATMVEWQRLEQRCPGARLVCLDLVPNRTTQAHEAPDVLNVGGFSDHVFTLVAEFVAGRLADSRWTAAIERIELDPVPAT